jgi:hypothetical protein
MACIFKGKNSHYYFVFLYTLAFFLLTECSIADSFSKARILLEQRKYIEAIREYKSVKDGDTIFYLATRYIGDCYYYLHQTDNAVRAYRRYLRVYPNDQALRKFLANLEMGAYYTGSNQPLASSALLGDYWNADRDEGLAARATSDLVIDYGNMFQGLAQEGYRNNSDISLDANQILGSPVSIDIEGTYGDMGVQTFPGYGLNKFDLSKASFTFDSEYWALTGGRGNLFDIIPAGSLDGAAIGFKECPGFRYGPRMPFDVSFGTGTAFGIGNQLAYNVFGTELSLPYSRVAQEYISAWRQNWTTGNGRDSTYLKASGSLNPFGEWLNLNGDEVSRDDVFPAPVHWSSKATLSFLDNYRFFGSLINEDPEKRPLSNQDQFLYQAYSQEDIGFLFEPENFRVFVGVQRRLFDRILVGSVVNQVDLAAVSGQVSFHLDIPKINFGMDLGAKLFQYEGITNQAQQEAILSRAPNQDFSYKFQMTSWIYTIYFGQDIYVDFEGKMSAQSMLGLAFGTDLLAIPPMPHEF